jgi:hypothetical protein
MKYFFASALSVCLLCAAPLLAQPVFNLSGLPPFGTTKTTTLVDGTGITPGPGGANQTWNFTAFPDTGTTNIVEIADPSETPFFSQFPAATSVSIIETIANDLTFYFNTYTRATDNAMELLGTVLYDQSLSGVYASVFSNPETIFAFPATLNSENADTYVSPGNFPANLLDPENTVTGNTSYLVDGYGTLVTSSGTYPNTLRFKRREIVLDTILSLNPKFPNPSYSESRNTTYEWVHIQNGASFTVWTISYDTSSTDQGFGLPLENFSSSTNHTYGEVNVGNSNLNASSSLGLYPNPAAHQVMVFLKEDATVSLLDLSGGVIKKVNFSVGDGNLPILDIDDLPAGTYLVKAEGQDYVATSKIVVIH